MGLLIGGYLTCYRGVGRAFGLSLMPCAPGRRRGPPLMAAPLPPLAPSSPSTSDAAPSPSPPERGIPNRSFVPPGPRGVFGIGDNGQRRLAPGRCVCGRGDRRCRSDAGHRAGLPPGTGDGLFPVLIAKLYDALALGRHPVAGADQLPAGEFQASARGIFQSEQVDIAPRLAVGVGKDGDPPIGEGMGVQINRRSSRPIRYKPRRKKAIRSRTRWSSHSSGRSRGLSRVARSVGRCRSSRSANRAQRPHIPDKANSAGQQCQ